jgi:hypothetical protein
MERVAELQAVAVPKDQAAAAAAAAKTKKPPKKQKEIGGKPKMRRGLAYERLQEVHALERVNACFTAWQLVASLLFAGPKWKVVQIRK